MKAFIFLVVAFAFLNNTKAQKVGDILKQQAGEGVKQGAAVGTERATDKVLSKLFTKKNKSDKSRQDNTSQTIPAITNNANNSSTGNNSSDASLQTYSKYDFVPGEKVLVYEDFSQDAVGDFPDKWNTNSAGEIVTTNGQPGHWLMLNKKGLFMPEYINNLPDNFTLEFDLVYIGSNPWLELFLLSGGTGKGTLQADVDKRSGVRFGIQPIPRDKGGLAHIFSYDNGTITLDNQVQFQNNGNTKIKVSIWRQKQRMRVYLDQNKVFDLPRAFPADKTYNMAMFQLWSEFENDNKYLIGNIKLAVGAPDTRNKLISEGKFSTTGILFDVNSANIKPESYGSLKDIANVLQDNSNVRVKIVGHTDKDGNDATNLALSKKRAESVKSYLINEFSIDASRLEADGKGASDPAASNNTPEGKAQNRRVEFVKL
jgi:outer membrane protein OmpA-like peptidoglycan-associated protein